jgi:putative transposase
LVCSAGRAAKRTKNQCSASIKNRIFKNMKMIYLTEWPQFYTATVLNWQHLLEKDKYKNLIVESLQFCVKENKVKLYAFVIMSNHIHLVWQQIPPTTKVKLQHSFMTFTAQKIKEDLQKNNPILLETFKVNATDRMYQIWERNPLTVDLFSPKVFYQKIDYVHFNPVVAGLCINPEDYYYSSSKFYATGIDEFDVLTHYDG